MKVGWIFPRNRQCGISIYAHSYLAELSKLIAVEEYDISEVLSFSSVIINSLNSCDCIHLQYEISFFQKNNLDSYMSLCKRLRPPLIISLHEVYDESPFDFPRNKITGNRLIKPFKLWKYDMTHRHLSAYRKHLKNNFYANKILVHYEYQRNLLLKAGLPIEKTSVVPFPIEKSSFTGRNVCEKDVLVLGSNGFINPTYNFNLLFQTLQSLNVPWKFIWIGCAVKEAHNEMLMQLREMIRVRGWENKFQITGWVTHKRRDEILKSLDIYLALFSARSSSASITRAIAAHCPIIAADLDLTRDLCRIKPVSAIVPKDHIKVVDAIEKILTEKKYVKKMIHAQRDLCVLLSFKNLALSLLKIYEEASGV